MKVRIMKLIHIRLGKSLGTEIKNRSNQVSLSLSEKVVINYKYEFAYFFYLTISRLNHNPKSDEVYFGNFWARRIHSTNNIIGMKCVAVVGLAGRIECRLLMDELLIEYKAEPHIMPKRFCLNEITPQESSERSEL